MKVQWCTAIFTQITLNLTFQFGKTALASMEFFWGVKGGGFHALKILAAITYVTTLGKHIGQISSSIFPLPQLPFITTQLFISVLGFASLLLCCPPPLLPASGFHLMPALIEEKIGLQSASKLPSL